VEPWPTGICPQPVASSAMSGHRNRTKLTGSVTKCPEWTARVLPFKVTLSHLAIASHQRLRAFVTRGTITMPAVMRQYTRGSYGIQPA
jgi:hypothetical protein